MQIQKKKKDRVERLADMCEMRPDGRIGLMKPMPTLTSIAYFKTK